MARREPAYKLLPLHGGDSQSEEEETIYDRRFGEGTYKKDEELLLYRSRDKSRIYNPSVSLRARMFVCGIVVLIILSIFVLTGYTVIAAWRNSYVAPSNATAVPNTPSSHGNDNIQVQQTTTDSTIKWRSDILESFSEMSILLHDINGDNVSDVILHAGSPYLSPDFQICPGQKEDKCMERVGYSPCQAQLVALDGNNGGREWNKWVQYATFAANCRADLNWNGQNDCIFAGRGGALAAYDIHNDVLLWIADPAITCPAYNYYYPLITTKDFDKDGVFDIIATHGGDPLYPDDYKERTPGFLVIVSGSTGQQISEHILTPDNRETYSSPVIYKLPDQKELVLFGSGGETISGSLWAITMDSLQDHVTQYIAKNKKAYIRNKQYKPASCFAQNELEKSRPGLKNAGRYSTKTHEDWMDNCLQLMGDIRPIWNTYKVCIYEFIPAGPLGTILPPVIVDVNKDSKMDLIVSQFGEHTLLYDGEAGNIIWDHFVPNTQTYSVPAPLHFNEDDVLDVVVRLNKGRWMTYDYSYMGVLDGTNGNLLWSLNCTSATMSSPLTLLSKKKGHDAMVFVGIGCESYDIEKANDGSNKHKRDTSKGKREKSLKCYRRYFETEVAKMCHTVTKREEEDGGGFFPANDGSGELPQNSNFGSTNLEKYLPQDLWESKDSTDMFPDPWEETEDFIQDYCGYNINSLTAGVYFITPNLVRDVRPLHVFRPYVFRKELPSMRSPPESPDANSHDDNPYEGMDNEMVEKLMKQMKDRKGLRCASIVAPVQLASTPAIADLENDGRVELVVSVSYTGVPGEYSSLNFEFLHPPKLVVQAFSIEDRFNVVYKNSDAAGGGDGGTITGEELVDFSSYYSVTEQPWTEYMGTNGNGVFTDPAVEKKN